MSWTNSRVTVHTQNKQDLLNVTSKMNPRFVLWVIKTMRIPVTKKREEIFKKLNSIRSPLGSGIRRDFFFFLFPPVLPNFLDFPNTGLWNTTMKE